MKHGPASLHHDENSNKIGVFQALINAYRPLGRKGWI